MLEHALHWNKSRHYNQPDKTECSVSSALPTHPHHPTLSQRFCICSCSIFLFSSIGRSFSLILSGLLCTFLLRSFLFTMGFYALVFIFLIVSYSFFHKHDLFLYLTIKCNHFYRMEEDWKKRASKKIIEFRSRHQAFSFFLLKHFGFFFLHCVLYVQGWNWI